MKPSEKFKLCPNCDGKAPLEVVICPYCAQNFSDLSLKSKSSLSSSYSPPYSAERMSLSQAEVKPAKEPETAAAVAVKEKSIFLPIALLTIGCNLVLLSALLLTLSNNGKLELEWSSNYWMLYALLGLPLLLVGYKILKKEK